jgi:hypothetical protein
MLPIPPEIGRLFEALLTNKGIPPQEHAYFHKWLRFYLDFCDKNCLDPFDKTNFSAFDAKLIAKHQTENQRKQARRAMAIYYRDIAGIQQNQQGRQQMGIERIPHQEVKASPVVRNVLDSQNRLIAEAAKKPLPRHPNYLAESLAAETRAPDPEEKMQPNRSATAQELKLTGADWVWVYEKLQSAIKVRHYSPKTWDVYKHWTQKLQTFTKSKDARLLTMDDVKGFLTFLAVEKKVAASSQNQAFNALLRTYALTNKQ